MANTVNDVMNVIASPDYGIKNIAGTNQEILAILSGTHNSKNNIHAIVNDIKNLLQTLVDTSSQKSKPIEVGDKSAKINHKHIESILDETKSIRKAIISLEKAVMKQGGQNVGVAKLTDKASQKVADAMVKDIEKQKKGGGMGALVDAFTKLKDISLKDIILGGIKMKSVSSIFKDAKKDLDIKEKDLNTLIKFINSMPEMVNALLKVSWKVSIISKNQTVKKLNEIFIGENSLLSLSLILKKNEKTFSSAAKVAKDIKHLISCLNKAAIVLIFAAVFSKLSAVGIKSLETMVDRLVPLAQKLIKNKSDIDKGTKVAKNITILVGNLLISSIFLTIAFIPALVGTLGALALHLMTRAIIGVAEILSKNNKKMGQAVASALILAAFTGLMALSSLFLASIAEIGIKAILGAILLTGIVAINIAIFSLLDGAKQQVIIGGVMMILMSISLIIFGIALKKMAEATKNLSWEQFGMIAALIGLFTASMIVIGIPYVAGLVALGAATMLLMSISLLMFGIALNKIQKGVESVNKESITKLGEIMTTLAGYIGGLSTEVISIGLGSAALGAMTLPLITFIATLKILSKMKTIPIKQLYQVMDAMSIIANYYKNNPIDREVIKQARKYKRMMRPFGNTLRHLAKLKKMGSIPMGLLYQTLDAMAIIANYYKNNPIDREVIKQARKYKRMLRPFGKTLKYLAKLQKMGSIPMGLLYQTLDAMTIIANYYRENPIDRKVIGQARKYKRMLRPFGKTLKHLTKLQKMGSIPTKLLHQVLDSMGAVAKYYKENPIDRSIVKISRRYKRMLKQFGKTVTRLDEIRNLKIMPLDAIRSTIAAITDISNFYNNITFGKNIKLKSILTKYIVYKFIRMAKSIQDKFTDIKEINYTAISSIVNSCNSIIGFYTSTLLPLSSHRIDNMNYGVTSFSDTIEYLNGKLQYFTSNSFTNVNLAVKSMKNIFNALKTNTLNKKQRKNAYKNLAILKSLSDTMSNVSNINSSTILSIGDALANTLGEVETIDLSQVEAVTNMFNAFNGINKSKNIIDKFTESVKDFTTSCNNLIDAMSNNTDAINNMETPSSGNSFGGSIKEKIFNYIGMESESDNSKQKGGIRISNVDEVAKAIAEKINGALSVDVQDAQIQLLINGSGGNEWTITRH